MGWRAPALRVRDDDSDRAGHRAAGLGGVVSTQEPKDGYRQRERPKERCLDVAKRNLLHIGGTEYKEGKRSPQRNMKPE